MVKYLTSNRSSLNNYLAVTKNKYIFQLTFATMLMRVVVTSSESPVDLMLKSKICWLFIVSTIYKCPRSRFEDNQETSKSQDRRCDALSKRSRYMTIIKLYS